MYRLAVLVSSCTNAIHLCPFSESSLSLVPEKLNEASIVSHASHCLRHVRSRREALYHQLRSQAPTSLQVDVYNHIFGTLQSVSCLPSRLDMPVPCAATNSLLDIVRNDLKHLDREGFVDTITPRSVGGYGDIYTGILLRPTPSPTGPTFKRVKVALKSLRTCMQQDKAFVKVNTLCPLDRAILIRTSFG